MSRLFDRLCAFGGDREDPDFAAELWDAFGVERTVVVVDMAGFTITSREKGVVYYLTLIQEMRALTAPLVEACEGAVVKFEADNLFAVFPHPRLAMSFVVAMMDEAACRNAGRERSQQIRLCAGLDHGMILLDDHDFFGDAVNLASKLGEDLARTGEVLVSETVRDQLGNEPYTFREVGSHGFYGTTTPVFRWERT